VAVPTYQHSLSEVIAALNAKIAALDEAKNAVTERINAGRSVSQNTKVLEDILASLQSAENAKALMEDSCCTSQNCNFAYYD
jgi:hypothetical protein